MLTRSYPIQPRVNTLVLAHSGTFLIAAGHYFLSRHSLPSFKCGHSVSTKHVFSEARLSGDEQLVFLGELFGTEIFIYSTIDLQIIGSLNEHEGAITSLLTFERYTYLISGSADKSIIVWEFKGQKRLRCDNVHADIVSCMATSKNEVSFVSGSWDRSIVKWSTLTLKPIATMVFNEQVRSVLVSPDGKSLLIGAINNIYWMKYHEFEQVKVFWNVHKAPITSLVLTSDEEVISGSRDGTIKFSSSDVFPLVHHQFGPTSLLLLDDELVSVGSEDQIFVTTLPKRSKEQNNSELSSSSPASNNPTAKVSREKIESIRQILEQELALMEESVGRKKQISFKDGESQTLEKPKKIDRFEIENCVFGSKHSLVIQEKKSNKKNLEIHKVSIFPKQSSNSPLSENMIRSSTIPDVVSEPEVENSNQNSIEDEVEFAVETLKHLGETVQLFQDHVVKMIETMKFESCELLQNCSVEETMTSAALKLNKLMDLFKMNLTKFSSSSEENSNDPSQALNKPFLDFSSVLGSLKRKLLSICQEKFDQRVISDTEKPSAVLIKDIQNPSNVVETHLRISTLPFMNELTYSLFKFGPLVLEKRHKMEVTNQSHFLKTSIVFSNGELEGEFVVSEDSQFIFHKANRITFNNEVKEVTKWESAQPEILEASAEKKFKIDFKSSLIVEQ